MEEGTGEGQSVLHNLEQNLGDTQEQGEEKGSYEEGAGVDRGRARVCWEAVHCVGGGAAEKCGSRGWMSVDCEC